MTDPCRPTRCPGPSGRALSRRDFLRRAGNGFGLLGLSYLLQDEWGQVTEAHSISAGLDYPGVGPEHAWLKLTERAEYRAVTDAEALAAFQSLSRLEGIIPALESSHAIAQVLKLKDELSPDDIVLVNLSGRGDKDMATVADALGVTL